MNSTRFTSEQQREFKLTLIEFINLQTKYVFFTIIFAGSLFALIMQQYTNPFWVFVWFCVYIFNFYLRNRILATPVSAEEVDEKLYKVTWLSTINGILHALVVFSLPLISLQEQMVIMIALHSLCAGAVASTVGYRPLFASFCIPIFIGILIGWLFLMPSNILSYVLFLLTSCYALLLNESSKSFFRTFKHSFNIRLEKDALNQQLEVALNDAVESEASKTRFLAATGHDLSQPMQSINLTLSTLSMQKLNKKSSDLIDNLKSSVETLNEQLTELLELARMDAGATKPTYINISLAALKKQLDSEFTSLTKKHGLAFKIDFPSDVYLHSDPMLLLRIFRNLLSNAVKYTAEGQIRVTASVSSEYCILKYRTQAWVFQTLISIRFLKSLHSSIILKEIIVKVLV